MPLLFRSSQGPWSVWTCECCGDPVKFTNTQERDWVREPKLYIAHHAPLGCPWERKGAVYDFTAEVPRSPLDATSKKSAQLTSEWEEDTPMSPNALQWWSEEDGAWRDDDSDR